MANLKIFSGRAHSGLSRTVAEYLGLRLGRVSVEAFPDGELLIRLDEDVVRALASVVAARVIVALAVPPVRMNRLSPPGAALNRSGWSL